MIDELLRTRLNKFTSETPEKTTYKKFNPNPFAEYHTEMDYQAEPFPEYEDWARMTQEGTLPSKFQSVKSTYPEIYPEYTPTEVPTEVLGELPTEIPGFSPEDIMNMITGGELSTAEINLMRDLGLVGGLEEEEVIEEEPVNFLSLAPEEARQKYEAGEISDEEWKSWTSYQKDIASLEKVTGVKPTPMAIMMAGREQGFTMKDEYIEALMGELDWDYDKCLNFYVSFITQHPDYPRQ